MDGEEIPPKRDAVNKLERENVSDDGGGGPKYTEQLRNPLKLLPMGECESVKKIP